MLGLSHLAVQVVVFKCASKFLVNGHFIGWLPGLRSASESLFGWRMTTWLTLGVGVAAVAVSRIAIVVSSRRWRGGRWVRRVH